MNSCINISSKYGAVKADKSIFETLGTNFPYIAIANDEIGCNEPSHGKVYVQEKHGYGGPIEIPWPPHTDTLGQNEHITNTTKSSIVLHCNCRLLSVLHHSGTYNRRHWSQSAQTGRTYLQRIGAYQSHLYILPHSDMLLVPSLAGGAYDRILQS